LLHQNFGKSRNGFEKTYTMNTQNKKLLQYKKMKTQLLLLLTFVVVSFTYAQNVGIGTTTPQATLDVKGNQRLGGTTHFTTFDSLGGKIEWRNANLYVPVSQYLMQHSAAADGLYYNNNAPISGQLEYRNATGNPVFFTNFSNGNGYFKNNLGINNLTPQFPLSFNGSMGDKISLWADGTATHYGFGIQSSLLQMFSKTNLDDIAFGYGSSSTFNERMRIINNGSYDGMILNGRLILKNGSADLVGGGGGAWLYKADNTALLGFMGAQNNQNIGFFGGPAGWGFTYDALNSRVGIGNNNPAYQLDVSSRMRIMSGGNNAASAGLWLNNNANTEAAFIGMEDDTHVGLYGAAGAGWGFGMNTVTGALKINGSEGVAGHILQSNGTAAPSWVAQQKLFISNNHTFTTLVNNGDETVVSSVVVTVTQNAHVEITGTVGLFSAGCFNCGNAQVFIVINDPLEANEKLVAANSNVISVTTMNFQYRTISPLPPGSYTFTVKAKKMSGPTVESAIGHTGPYGSPIARLTAKVIPF
jgi:hypothetical protein